MALSNLYVQRSVNALNEELRSDKSDEEKRKLIDEYIQRIENDSRFDIDNQFPPNLTWFNTPKELSFSNQLKGKLVILDFFTYCCINCLHILPDLHNLEERFEPNNGLVIVGVHSAKFPNEKGTVNLQKAIMKYAITHPVVNDPDIIMWERLNVSCWPTLVFINPLGRLIYYIIGEGHNQEMTLFTETALEYYKRKSVVTFDPIEISLEKNKAIGDNCQLAFSGKIAATDSHLYVSDTGNHRVLVVNRDTGTVEEVYGNGSPGLCDGCKTAAQFRSPQGMAIHKGSLYIADCENHCIRKINLQSGEVSTVLGTGCQGNDKEGGAKGTEQEISSPWDVTMITGPESDRENILCLANSGTHQLWAYFLEDSKWFKGSNHGYTTALRMSGSGDEANRNNTFAHKASFAQPSGITVDHKSNTIFVADSESSTIRAVSTQNGSVKALIGGGLDPMDLFAFGDKDGKGREVRLQHPLAVAWDCNNGLLYIADSYNHKIKVCNPVGKTCHTLAGTGEPGLKDGVLAEAQFSEPGGVCVADEGKTLFISDTNNSCIRKINLLSKTVEKVNIVFESPDTTDFTDDYDQYTPIIGRRAKKVTHPHPVKVPSGDNKIVTIKLEIVTSEGFKLSDDQESMWQVPPQSEVSVHRPNRGSISGNNRGVEMRFSLQPEEATTKVLKVELLLCYCSEADSACLMHQALLDIPVVSCTTTDSTATVADGEEYTLSYHVTGD